MKSYTSSSLVAPSKVRREQHAWSEYAERLTPERTRLFWSYVTFGARTACWLWKGSCRPSGYGAFGLFAKGKTPASAHRIAYGLTHGELPEGLHVCHRCDNPPCVAA